MKRLEDGSWMAERNDFFVAQKSNREPDGEIPWIQTPGPWTQAEIDCLMERLTTLGGYPKGVMPIVDGYNLMVAVL